MQLHLRLRFRLIRVWTDVLIGALLALTGFFVYLTQLEEYHFTRLVHSALDFPLAEHITVPHTEANTLLIMKKVNAVVNGRYGQIADVGHPEPGLLWSSDEHLTEPSGACASYTQVLAKALETSDYPIRKVGLSKGGQCGIHHVLETYVEGHWVLMDCMSNLAFRREDGQLASAAEVHANWEFYGKQTPPGYNPDYDYSTFYYTNWDKVPVVGAIVQGVPPLHRWMEAHGVSVWFLLLDVNQWFAGFSFTGALLLIGARLWPKIRRWRSRRSHQEGPEEVRRPRRPLTSATAA
jgi:hypothetical protein